MYDFAGINFREKYEIEIFRAYFIRRNGWKELCKIFRIHDSNSGCFSSHSALFTTTTTIISTAFTNTVRWQRLCTHGMRVLDLQNQKIKNKIAFLFYIELF